MPKCQQCGNEDFTGVDTSSPFVCPIPGCGAAQDKVQIRTGLSAGASWMLQYRKSAPKPAPGGCDTPAGKDLEE